jgi:proteasome lid subunit RPN8/RPN11
MSHPPLEIVGDVIDEILNHAREARADEVMGLLASKIGTDSGVVTAACLLPATATPSRAEAAPPAIQQAAERLRANGLRPVGLWHSHGSHAVFHSPTDDETVSRQLPAMAPWSFERARPRLLAPVVTSADEAVLPFDDGQALRFILLGSEVPGIEAHQRARWGSVAMAFGSATKAPCAVQGADFLRLDGGGVRITLGVPPGTSLTSRIEAIAPLRIAHLYSLVVNNRGDRYAEAMTILEFDDQTVMQKGPCEIVIVQNSCSPPARNHHPFIAGRFTAAPEQSRIYRINL